MSWGWLVDGAVSKSCSRTFYVHGVELPNSAERLFTIRRFEDILMKTRTELFHSDIIYKLGAGGRGRMYFKGL
jgi:hypothetical protein